MNTITIGLPVYNADRFIRDTIQSVLDQTFSDFRLIILDDGSTDNSIEIIKSFDDFRIELIQDGYNRGLPYRLNQIAKLTKTKYLARMDADDIMHPEKIEKQLKILKSHPEIDVLGTNAYSIDENNNVNGIRLSFDKDEILRKVNGFIHPTIVAKTEWFLNNPYDLKAVRIEDAELWFRTSYIYSFHILTEPLFFYREFGNDYYKKYFKGFASIFYVLKKYNYDIKFLKFTLKYYISGLIFLFFNLFGKEDILVRKRNAISLYDLKIDEVLKM